MHIHLSEQEYIQSSPIMQQPVLLIRWSLEDNFSRGRIFSNIADNFNWIVSMKANQVYYWTENLKKEKIQNNKSENSFYTKTSIRQQTNHGYNNKH